MSNPTLIITGTHNNNVPPANSLIIAGKISGVYDAPGSRKNTGFGY